MSRHPPGLQDFNDATLVNTSGLIPKEAGSEETFKFKPASFKIENGTQIYIAIQAENEAGLTSEVSNIAQAVNFIPPREPSNPNLGNKMPVPCLTVLVFVATLFIF